VPGVVHLALRRRDEDRAKDVVDWRVDPAYARASRPDHRNGGGGVTTTADATTALFDDMSSRGRDPSLVKITGTVRFDLVNGKTEQWLVAIRKGDVTVSRRNAAADSVIRMNRTLFERICSGQTNILPAILRGEVVFEGDYRLMMLVRRLIRAQLAAKSRESAGYARRQR
jgi:putative sterol carrier protein